MERHAVIKGISRQAKAFGLPLPYAVGVMWATMLPFVWIKEVWWLATGLAWYIGARVATALNPNGHRALIVVLRKTPPQLSRKKRKAGKHYV